MKAGFNLQNVGDQLAKFEVLNPKSPKDAEEALHGLQELSREVKVALDKIQTSSTSVSASEMFQIQDLVSRIERTNERLLKQSPLGLASAKIAEIMKTQM